MKNLLLLAVVLFVVPVVVADHVDVALFKEVFAPVETMQVLVQLHVAPVYAPDVNTIRLKDVQGNSIRVAPIVNRIHNDVYFYNFDLPPLSDGQYTVEVGPLKYVENEVLKEFFFTHNFTVKDKGFAVQVQPAFLLVGPDLELKITNVGESMVLSVNTSAELSHPYDRAQSVAASRSRYFSFSLNNKTVKYDLFVNFSSTNGFFYVPVFNRQTSVPVADVPVVENVSFELSPVAFAVDLPVRGSSSLTWEIKNNGRSPLRVSFLLSSSLKDVIQLNASSVQVSPSTVFSQFMWLNRDGHDVRGVVAGTITVASEYQSIVVPVSIAFPAFPSGADEQEPFVAPETKIVEQPAEKSDSFGGLELFKNKTYTPPPVAPVSKTPLIIVLVVVGIAVFTFFAGKKRTKEQTFDQYLEQMRKRRS